MARTITRQTFDLFGGSGSTTNFGQFGSQAAAAPVKTKSIPTIQQLSAYAQGWQNAVAAGEAPYLEDMNGLFYLYAYQGCYMFQEGIPEWDSATTYFTGSVVKNLANAGYTEFYVSLTDANLNNTLPTRTDNTNWKFLYALNNSAGMIFPTMAANIAMGANKITGIGDGTAGAPSLAGSSHANTGIAWNIASNTLSFIANGVEAMRINGTQQIEINAGSVSAPPFAFLADTSSGVFQSSPNTVSLVGGGAEALRANQVTTSDNVGAIPATVYGGGNGNNAANHLYTNPSVSTSPIKIAEVDTEACFVVVYGHDAGFTKGFVDILISGFTNPSPTVVSQRTAYGSPAARTYSAGGSGVLDLAMASGTYLVAAYSIQLSGR